MKSIVALLALAAFSQVIFVKTLSIFTTILLQAYPESRATCEECTQGLQNFPAAIGELSDVMEEDLSHHYCHKPGTESGGLRTILTLLTI